MDALTLVPPGLQARLTSQGLTCQLLTPQGDTQDIKKVIIHQAGPGSGFTKHTEDLYKDIVARGDTAVLLYTPWSGRFGKTGAIEELGAIISGVLDVYGRVDLGIVATSGGQKIVLEAAAAGVLRGVHKCVFINGALEKNWSYYSPKKEKRLAKEQSEKDKKLEIQRSAIQLACSSENQTGWSRYAMQFFNWLSSTTPDYAFENRGFYLSPAFLEAHSNQAIYNLLRDHYIGNAAVFLPYAWPWSFYWKDQTSALQSFSKSGVNFLVISGTEDRTVHPEQSQKTVDAINAVKGSVRKVELPVGHMADVENPESVRNALNDFFT